jgi:hypothetical protein
MDKMNVVTFKSTNHVLGAVVRSAQADKPITVTEVAADGIAVRDSVNAGLRSLIDAAQLQVAVVDYDTRVFYRPQLVVVADGRVEQQDERVVTVTLDGSTVEVDLPDNTLSDIEVFVYITGGGLTEPAVRAVPVPRNTDDGSAGLVLGAGDYTVVVFAPGYATAIDLQTVT